MTYRQTPIYRVRCSALGKLMTPGRSKAGGLSQTAKTHVVEWYKEQLYDRRKEIASKYTTKGNVCEDASIEYINRLYGTDYVKNEQWYEDDIMHGTPDIVGNDIIIDIKNSWDFMTFPLFGKTIPTRDYMYQVQGYMMLTGKRKASVIYTLMDTPYELIEREWKQSGGTTAVPDEFRKSYEYSGIADELRVKRYDFEYSEKMAQEIRAKVEEAREFVKSLSY